MDWVGGSEILGGEIEGSNMFVKNLLIAVKKQPKHWVSARQQWLAYVEKADCLEFKVLGISLYPLLFLSNGLKITASILPAAPKDSWEKPHG